MSGQQPDGDAPVESRPLFAIESANHTAHEIAAVTAVLAAAMAQDDEPDTQPANNWSNPVRGLRQIGHPGPDAWRAEFAPR